MLPRSSSRSRSSSLAMRMLKLWVLERPSSEKLLFMVITCFSFFPLLICSRDNISEARDIHNYWQKIVQMGKCIFYFSILWLRWGNWWWYRASSLFETLLKMVCSKHCMIIQEFIMYYLNGFCNKNLTKIKLKNTY